MKTKKIIAWLSAIALASTMFVSWVSAANISDILVNWDTTSIEQTTAITEIKFSAPENVWNVTVKYDSSIDDTGFVNTDVAVANADTTLWATSVVVNTTDKTITFVWDWESNAWVVTITISNSHFKTPTAKQNISFSVIAWSDMWAVVIPVDWANEITVTAEVEPILTMEVEWDVNFWTLTADKLTAVNANIAYTTTNGWDSVINTVTKWTAITIWTNATAWYSVKVKNLWLIDAHWNEISAADTEEDLSDWAWKNWYWIRVVAPTASNTDCGNTIANCNAVNNKSYDGHFIDWVHSWDLTISWDFDATWNLYTGLSTSDQVITTSDKPVSWQVTVVEYWVHISTLQAAWNYTDTVTYTVTWNF